ncbi:MAG: acetate kinase [Candidatus Scalindua rubra]|uniref:Acetate kinase n=1 Tax=Candidatus Scalindua brodae TaxID=237368 RepID=A0A0B0EJR7_9BACT|nr:MAG: Acetate kinase [Candidatus Scalindua brodae]MBZ0109088.1 acetate kinase [Candidatus Scalindua rubra]TWU33521.1 Acetate kinase [Candidatus Brocadiaceae bacterium S225]
MNRKSDLKVLVINCGSSSVKFQLLNMADENVLTSGIVERLGLPQSLIKFKFGNKGFTKEFDTLDHSSAISEILDAVTHSQLGVIDDKSEISAVGHRVVHGAEHFTESVLITDDTIKQIEACIELAPLHNPHNLKGILVCRKLLTGIPQVAVFDTAFHQTMEDYVYTYALAYRFYEKYRFRRYGFHGTSHFFVANKAAEIVGNDIHKLKIITCHLGNGASIAAVKYGKSIDTSMGFTPLEGLIMGTRCGDVDPAMALFIMEKEGLSPHGCDMLMNHECGLIGISGISSDMRDLIKAYKEGNDRARLALQMYSYRIRKYIGMYSASMNGVDVIVFTGGIGENAALIRNMCCADMKYLGIDFDEEKNRMTIGTEGELTAQNSKVRVLCVPTNEELVIARDTVRIVNGK